MILEASRLVSTNQSRLKEEQWSNEVLFVFWVVCSLRLTRGGCLNARLRAFDAGLCNKKESSKRKAQISELMFLVLMVCESQRTGNW